MSDHPFFLLIGGLKESGKSTFADMMPTEHNGLPVLRLEMSRDVHAALWTLDPVIPVDPYFVKSGFPFMRYREYVGFYGLTEAKRNPEVRRLLQAIGDGVGRDLINEETWVNLIFADVHAALAGGQSVILSGIRRPNELGMKDEVGSLVTSLSVYLRRTTSDGIRDSHGSENAIRPGDFDLIVENTSDLDTLRLDADVVWKDLITEQDAS